MKKISFIPSSELSEIVVDSPLSSKKFIPEWYKKIVPINEKNISFNKDLDQINTNVKMCMPFFDALTCGYIQKTWSDILIKNYNGEVSFNFAVKPEIVKFRGRPNIPIDDRYYPYEFIFIQPWIPKLPKGYSALITHPFNRTDLPFHVLSGIVDYDVFHHVPGGNIPFYLKNNFEGIIPSGTPMYQIIPFKRESWINKKEKFDPIVSKKKEHLVMQNFINSYKNRFWFKKIYN